MKRLLPILMLLSGCGYSSLDNELIGQVKAVRHETPIICPDYYNVDISLGVMRNGVGSMSTQDVWMTITDRDQFMTLLRANASGQLVKIRYDVKRFAYCIDHHVIRSVEVVP